jgi:O2-independent ubiquinone biosynthesis protein UbiU
MELLCPAGNLSSLKSAIDNGADAVYIGFKNGTNARHFAGLNFTDKKLEQAICYVNDHRKHLHIAINTFASANNWHCWQQSVDKAVELGAHALIISDISVLDYASQRYPDQEIHLSVQASATNSEAIRFYQQRFNIKRVVLPRVLSMHQVKQLARSTDIELEVFAYGSLCIMAEGRCHLSSYLTGESPNMNGVCSPAKHVRWKQTEQGLESWLNEVLIDRYQEDESAGYPTLCKGRFNVGDQTYHALEEPTSLNSMALLPELMELGIASLKIEGRQRSSAYVASVAKTWREAIDKCASTKTFSIEPQWQQKMSDLSEGSQTTLGAYHKQWQ